MNQNVRIIESQPLLVLAERSAMDRLNFDNLPPYSKLEIRGAADLAALEIRFTDLKHRQIFVNVGKNDYIRGVSMRDFQHYIEEFIRRLSHIVGDKKFVNICFIRPRYHKDADYNEEQKQAGYISMAYSIFLNHYPQTIMFTQDSRDEWVSQAYKSLFHDMIRHPIADNKRIAPLPPVKNKEEEVEAEQEDPGLLKELARAKAEAEEAEQKRQAELEALAEAARRKQEEEEREAERLAKEEAIRAAIAAEEAERERQAELERIRKEEEALEAEKLAEELRRKQEEEEAKAAAEAAEAERLRVLAEAEEQAKLAAEEAERQRQEEMAQRAIEVRDQIVDTSKFDSEDSRTQSQADEEIYDIPNQSSEIAPARPEFPPVAMNTPKILHCFIYCKNLPDSGSSDKIDPYVKISAESPTVHIIDKKDKTETIKNQLNPVFMNEVIFEFEKPTDVVKFKLQNSNLFKDDTVDAIAITAIELQNSNKSNYFGYNQHDFANAVGKNGKPSSIFIQAIRHEDYQQKIEFDALAENLKDKKCDPYFQICLSDGGFEFHKIFSSDTKKNDASPDWGKISLPLARFGIEKENAMFILKAWDYNKSTDDEFVGSTRPNKISNGLAEGHLEFQLYNQSNQDDEMAGQMILRNFHLN